MIKIIGRTGCTSCLMAKKLLNKNKIVFDYVDLEEMTKEDQDEWITKAEESGRLSLPFIIKDGEFMDLKEVIASGR